jgi:DNA repair exonuclease SbcCD ATPase subunit
MAVAEREEEALAEELAEARRELEALQGQVADAEARAAHYRQQAALLQQQLEEARQEAARRQEELAQARDEAEALRQQLRQAALRYREARLAARPELPPELVTGETLEEIDQQLQQAEGIVARLRERMAEEAQGQRFPAGAPPRRAPDLSALSPLEKIRQGLQGR